MRVFTISEADLRGIMREELSRALAEAGMPRARQGFMGRKEAASYLGISERTLDRESSIPFHRVASIKRYKVSDLDAYGRTDRAAMLADKLAQLKK
jgi:hypothetical protein